MTDQQLIERMYRERPPTTQPECCALAVRVSLALWGPMEGDSMIRAAVDGLTQGLFGEAYVAASDEQKQAWNAMMDRAYRDALEAA